MCCSDIEYTLYSKGATFVCQIPHHNNFNTIESCGFQSHSSCIFYKAQLLLVLSSNDRKLLFCVLPVLKKICYTCCVFKSNYTQQSSCLRKRGSVI